MTTQTRRTILASFAIILLALVSGCGSSNTTSSGDDDNQSLPAPAGAPTIAVTLTDSGCSPDMFSGKAGTLVFAVTNHNSTKVKEMEIQFSNGNVVNDVTGVEPGQTRDLVIDVKAGSYKIKCPETATTVGTLTVS